MARTFQGSPAPAPSGLSTRLGAVCAVGAAFFLSGNNAAVTVYYDDGGSVAAMMFLRYVFYVIAVGLALQAGGFSLRLAEGAHGRVAVIGVFYVAGMLALLTAFTLIPVGLAVLVLYTFPIATTLIDALLRRRFPGTLFLLCLVVALAGLALALEIHDRAYDPLGIAAASFAALGFAATFVLSERWFAAMPAMKLSFHISIPGLVVVTLIYIGYLLSMNAPGMPAWTLGLPPLGSYGSYAAGLALAYYAIAVLMMFRAIQEAGGPATAMIMNLEPVFTFALVFVFLSAPITWANLAGGAVVIAAVLLAQLVTPPAAAVPSPSRRRGADTPS